MSAPRHAGMRTAATNARWYFDFISPFAYLQWRRLKTLRDVLAIEPVPILFAAVLDQIGQKGPAEIPGKRRFTYRHVQWRARQDGVPLRFPPAHPFNPLAALRLAIAAGGTAAAIDAIFAQIWQRGEAADTPAALAQTAAVLGIADVDAALAAPAVKDALRRNTEAALAHGVFGVPTLALGEELFWGDDATAMAVDYARGALSGDDYARIDSLPQAVTRRGA